ncbi:hypothetical protein [Streptomyces sp. CB03911]|uniref:hypothetical protein n=1 Tax=Streptomyces sp. CB03911 TaxID=1804758 RepID=UPI00093ED23A|nr:hypothetical protein [Streptomyces sp. CB03911]OKI14213.1 hypothetical protein A6A07_13770 [Streptomyces sp. CB03911]
MSIATFLPAGAVSPGITRPVPPAPPRPCTILGCNGAAHHDGPDSYCCTLLAEVDLPGAQTGIEFSVELVDAELDGGPHVSVFGMTSDFSQAFLHRAHDPAELLALADRFAVLEAAIRSSAGALTGLLEERSPAAVGRPMPVRRGCVIPDCAEHDAGANSHECYGQLAELVPPCAVEPILLSALSQVADEDTVVVTVWPGDDDGAFTGEEPAEVRDFAERLRAFADQLDVNADQLAALQAGTGAGR